MGKDAIPAKALVKLVDQDLLASLQSVLRGVNVLGSATKDASGGAFTIPDQGEAIIESGATSLTKWYAGTISAAGGATVIFAAVNKFWVSQQGGTKIALIGGVAAVITGLAISLALIVSSDIRCRAMAAHSVYEARRGIAIAYLEAAAAAATQTHSAVSREAPASNGAGTASVSRVSQKESARAER